MSEPPTKKLRSSIPSKQSREKEKNKKKEDRKFMQLFIKMLKQELSQSNITEKNLPFFLFRLAGYDFNPDTFQIFQRPSKFGGIWKEEQPVCDKCGANWKCKLAEGAEAQKNTNGIFHLSCPKCGLNKYWTTQGEDGFLDDQLNLEIFSDF